MREWERLQQAAHRGGAHKVEFDEIHNLWRCIQCKSTGTVVMSAVFLQIMRQPCVFTSPKGKSNYHANRLGQLQLNVLKYKWTADELILIKAQTGGVQPIVGNGQGLEWCDAAAIRRELERMGARKLSFV